MQLPHLSVFSLIKRVFRDALKDGKPYAEMQTFDKTAKLNLSCIELSDSFSTGKLNNKLGVMAKTYESKTYKHNLGEDEVSLPVKSNPAKFDMDKSLETSLCQSDTYAVKSYFVVGDKVVFRLTSKNVGGKAGKLIMTDTYPAGLTYESAETFVDGKKAEAKITHDSSGKSIEIEYPDNIGAGKEAYALVTFTVAESDAETLYLKNTVKNNYDSTSDESITVKKLSADISVTKTSNVSVSVSDKEIPEIKPITISKLDMTNGEKELAGATLKGISKNPF